MSKWTKSTLIIDTSVLIPVYCLHSDIKHEIAKVIEDNLVLYSRKQFEEFRDKLISKFKYNPTNAAEIAEKYTDYTALVDDIDLGLRKCRDADDDYIINNAVAYNIDYLLTYDKDLLELEGVDLNGSISFKNCKFRVLKPRDFLVCHL
jgi:putative PIN family toxin of toxin-antitoxin system